MAGCASATRGAPSGVIAPGGEAGALLVAAGDIACAPGTDADDDECRQNDTADLVVGLDPDAVLAVGDTQYEEGTAEEYSAYDGSWGKFLDITLPVVGNHEYFSGDADGYFGYFGDRAGKPDQGWYATDVGAWRVIVLNSECAQVGGCDAGSPQGKWLADELAEHPSTCTLAAWHSPRFSSGEEHGDDEEVAPLWEQVQAAGVEVVLNGHDHDYERFAPQDAGGRADPDGPVEFVVGTGGRNLKGFRDIAGNSEVRWSDSFGVLAMTLRPGGYDWRFVGPDGTGDVDSGSARCR